MIKKIIKHLKLKEQKKEKLKTDLEKAHEEAKQISHISFEIISKILDKPYGEEEISDADMIKYMSKVNQYANDIVFRTELIKPEL